MTGTRARSSTTPTDDGAASTTAALFTPFTLRGVTLRNRVAVSPMCQYSSPEGFATDWHLVHLGSRAVGGAALVMVEATAVTRDGRISPWDMGLWDDAHIAPLARVAAFMREHGAEAGIQLAHAGRKASTAAPWEGGGYLSPAEGGWRPLLAPSSLPFRPTDPVPEQMTTTQIEHVVGAFARAAERARQAGFRVVELHAAHGYLLHEFLSPLSNRRMDSYGGSLENRMRFTLEVTRAVRRAWPAEYPLFVRISATDWVEGGWDVEQSVVLARALREAGADLIDCSSGGNIAGARIPVAPGYQTPFAERIRRDAGIATAAVGLITGAEQAEEIIERDCADLVMLARAELRDPYWPLHAARRLGATVEWPPQYERARD